MTLSKNKTTTALALIPRDKKAKKAAEAEAAKKAPAADKSDKVDIKGYNGDEVPSDDDGPGAGGGYKPAQDPVEGPGAGGGYDPDEIPADDDGGDGTEPTQDPAESDGPGAGGGYLTLSSSTALHWNRPLTVFSSMESLSAFTSTNDFLPHWIQVLPQDSFHWTGSGLLLAESSTVTPETRQEKADKAADKPAKDVKKA